MKPLVIIAIIASLAPRAHAKGCHEVSRVVGYEHCFRFGGWSRDEAVFPLQLDLGWFHQSFMARPFTITTEAPGRESIEPSTLGAITDGLSMRFLGGSRLVYGGLEMDTSALENMPLIPDLPESGASWSFLGVFGLHASLWRFTVGAEVAAGARIALFSYCDGGKACAQEDVQSLGVVDGRVHFEVFPHPNWSLGVMYGHSLLDANDQSFMLYTGLHFRAIDGMP
ncbi:MAG TPA: hypothetical protein VGG74_36840 [Kofleriaceae bacterium]